MFQVSIKWYSYFNNCYFFKNVTALKIGKALGFDIRPSRLQTDSSKGERK